MVAGGCHQAATSPYKPAAESCCSAQQRRKRRCCCRIGCRRPALVQHCLQLHNKPTAVQRRSRVLHKHWVCCPAVAWLERQLVHALMSVLGCSLLSGDAAYGSADSTQTYKKQADEGLISEAKAQLLVLQNHASTCHAPVHLQHAYDPLCACLARLQVQEAVWQHFQQGGCIEGQDCRQANHTAAACTPARRPTV